MPVIEVRHPLVRHKVGLLREVDISTKKFREITERARPPADLRGDRRFPAREDDDRMLERADRGRADQRQEGHRGADPARRPRHADGVLDMIPSAKVSVVGLARNHETLQPENYFERFVGHLAERDRDHHRPDAGDGRLDDRDGQPAEVARLHRHPRARARRGAGGHRGAGEAHPDVRCWTAAIDSHLNERLHHPWARRRGGQDLRDALTRVAGRSRLRPSRARRPPRRARPATSG